jgi:hypothetical protein
MAPGANLKGETMKQRETLQALQSETPDTSPPGYWVHITPKSNNAKTGPMMVTTSPRDYCPPDCKLQNNGCYAESGPLVLHWSKVSEKARGVTWGAFLDYVQSKLKPGEIFRHNQAGDLPGAGGLIDAQALQGLTQANKKAKARGFTYTHYNPTNPHNGRAISAANTGGFTVNLSADNVEHADTLKALEIGPVVCLLPENTEKAFFSPGGHRVIVCPATYKKDVSCFTCGLCQLQRGAIIGFPVHGTGKKKAHKVFMMGVSK